MKPHQPAGKPALQIKALDYINDGVLMADAAGAIIHMNPSMRRMLQLPADDAIRMAADLDPLIQLSGPASFAELLTLATTQGVWTGEASCRLTDSHKILLHLRAQALSQPNGAPIGVLVAVRDAIREQALEKQVILSQQMELVENFIGSIAHEFKNQLTILMAYATLLKDALKGQSNEDDTNKILETAQKANELTTRMMAIARPSPPRLESLDVFTVLNDLFAILRKTLPPAIELIAPDTRTLPRIYCDPVLLYRALLNLCLNARDAMPGGGRIAIAIDWICLDKDDLVQWPDRQPGVYMILAVTDTGEGIPPEIKTHIFEPFFTTKPNGTGLGLCVVQHTLKSMGGWITAASQLGKGSCFRVYLPAVQQEGIFARGEPASAEPATGSESILIVDDDPVTLSMIHRFLQKSGFTVWAADGGDEALKVYREHSSDIRLVLMDVVMPGMNGVELYRELNKINPGIPILVMSGFPQETADRLIKESNAPFLAKPFSHARLTQEIRRLLDKVP